MGKQVHTGPTDQCRAITREGTRCKLKAIKNGYCHIHAIDDSDLDRRLTFLYATHSFIFENYKFADQKAGVIILLNTGLIGGLYGLDLLVLDPTKEFWFWTSIIAFSVLGFAIALAIAIVYPRGTEITRKASGGLFAIPSKIPSGRKQQEFTDGFKKLQDEELIDELCALIYGRGKTESRKYRLIRISILASAFGWLVSVVLILVSAKVGGPG